jgi:4-diphosphocytidyl-2-C-methyl-D-erythritol kinase
VSRLQPFRVRAFAKVNLDLRVLGRRDDGYHEIRTIFQTIALHDTLSFAPRRGPLELSASGEQVPLDGTNIVIKAAEAVWRAAGRKGRPQGTAIHLAKRIPTQAGLGGGSSDAAATVLALNRLWRAGLRAPDLLSIAGQLGSDVPFFLLGGTALGLGRGEVLYPLPDLPPAAIVVGQAGEGVSTAAAYGWLRAAQPAAVKPQQILVPWFPGSLNVLNDFEPVVLRRVPAARRLRRSLLEAGANVAMLSGSGSAVFGLFSDGEAARRAAGRLRNEGSAAWLTKLKGRGPSWPVTEEETRKAPEDRSLR